MNYKGICKVLSNLTGISLDKNLKHFKNDSTSHRTVLNNQIPEVIGSDFFKLQNSYNIGLGLPRSEIDFIGENSELEKGFNSINFTKNSSKPDIAVISTGGTVASVIDNETGAVHPAFTAEDLIMANPGLAEQANISGKTVLKILSENMNPKHWIESARAVADEINNGMDGVVVAHGTDTLHYTSSALSFILDTPVPVVLTGALISPDVPDSDASMNLMNSVTAAKSDIAEVMVCMQATESDSFGFIHKGTRVRKMHSSRKDAFKSMNISPIGKVQNGNIKIIDKKITLKTRNNGEVKLRDSLEEKVAFIKCHPGISGELIDYHTDKNYKGILMEGTGLGHCPEDILSSLQRANDSRIPVVMTSQCLYGGVDMQVYSSGRKLTSAGVISAGNMLPETAFVKLMWVLGQTEDLNEVKNIIQTDIAGEIQS